MKLILIIILIILNVKNAKAFIMRLSNMNNKKGAEAQRKFMNKKHSKYYKWREEWTRSINE